MQINKIKQSQTILVYHAGLDILGSEGFSNNINNNKSKALMKYIIVIMLYLQQYRQYL